MTGYYINAYQIIQEYFDNNDLPIPNNVNKYVDYIIRGERRIATGSTKVPFKRYFRRGRVGDEGLEDSKLLMPAELNRLNTVADEDGLLLSYFVKGRHIVFNDPDYVSGLDCIVIRYEGLMLDDNGYPLVASNHAEVLQDFIDYSILKDKYFRGVGEIARHVYQDMKNELDDKVLDARAQDMAPSDEVLQMTEYIMNSLIAPNWVDATTMDELGIIIIDNVVGQFDAYFGKNTTGDIPILSEILLGTNIKINDSITCNPDTESNEFGWFVTRNANYNSYAIDGGNEGTIGDLEFIAKKGEVIINDKAYYIYVYNYSSFLKSNIKLYEL